MPPTLLLADDSVTIQRVIELTFADEDVRVVAVSDGEQAIASMAASPPDIVLVDAAMPGRSGYEVAEYMRRTPGLTDVPVLLLAGAFEPIDRARADAARCAGVLVKPFEPQQVIARVQELLTRPAGASPDAASTPVSQPERMPAPTPAGAPAGSVDEYFDRLDKALGGAVGSAASSTGARAANEDLMAWFASKKTAGESGGERPALAAVAAPSSTRSVGPRSMHRPLAAAFLALLDAERSAAPSTLPEPEPSEALIEKVAARVLDRLSDHVVPSAVSDVVSAIAERLVQEEIDRLKAAVAEEGGRDGP